MFIEFLPDGEVNFQEEPGDDELLAYRLKAVLEAEKPFKAYVSRIETEGEA